MTDDEVAAETGLTLVTHGSHASASSTSRSWSWSRRGAPELLAAIEREGKRWTTGGRFHHITGATDKAAAVRLLVALYRRQLGTSAPWDSATHLTMQSSCARSTSRSSSPRRTSTGCARSCPRPGHDAGRSGWLERGLCSAVLDEGD